MSDHPLLRALRAIEPQATFSLLTVCDWYSMTFAGQQVQIECLPATKAIGRRMRSTLRDHEFSLARKLVADTSVVGDFESLEAASILIEALIIDE